MIPSEKKFFKGLWCTFEIVCVSSGLEPCWIFFQIHKESLSGYFTVWVYTASFPWQVIIEYHAGFEYRAGEWLLSLLLL